MTTEERVKTMAFILGRQAQLTATVGRLSVAVYPMAGKVDLMAEKVIGLTEKVDGLGEKVDRTAAGAAALLAIAGIHEREMRETGGRLNALIDTVERHISEGHNGRA